MDNDKVNKENMPYLIKITKFVYKQYKEDLKNNADSDYLGARKRLTRNWILGEYVNSTKDFEIRRYGNLHMTKDRYDDRIVSIFNDRYHRYDFNINMDDKRMLDSLYGLDKEDNNTYSYEVEINKENTYEIEDNSRFAKLLIHYTEKFGQALKILRG